MAESRKIGRSKRAPSNKTQTHRTKANKARNIESAKKCVTGVEPHVPHGTARAKRRASVDWDKVFDARKNNGRDNIRWQDYIS